MDHPIRWLLDLVVTLAFIYWQRSRERPALRLVPRSATPVRRIVRANTGLVAVLVSHAGMEERVRGALGERTGLYFTRTWAQLQDVVTRLSPFVVLADPLADSGGDPQQHLIQFSAEWRIPVVLYSTLTPACAEMLVGLGRAGIRHIVFHRVDDNPDRFVEVIPWDRDVPPPYAA